MKKFKVELTKLAQYGSVEYQNEIPVYYNYDLDTNIGTCKISVDNGRHFGDVELNIDISENVFFYYREHHSEAVEFNFTALHFTDDELRYRPTTRLYEMII